MLCQAINSIFLNIILSIFMSFGRQKAKYIFPPESCHGPAGGFTANHRPPAAFCSMCMSHAQLIWAPPVLLMLTFFSVLTPVYANDVTLYSHCDQASDM